MEEIYDIKELQAINKIILDETVRVCEKYNIRYFLDYGALIGAIRHQAFIPWDDDVDLTFTRDEYEKFIRVAQKEWKEGPFFVHKPEDFLNDKFLDFTTRVVYEEAAVHVNTYDKVGKENAQRIWGKPVIDIFVLDNIPDSKIKQKTSLCKMIFFYGLLMGHRAYIDYQEYHGIAKAVVCILAHIGKWFPAKTLEDKYFQCILKYRECEGEYYRASNINLACLGKNIKRSWYRTGTPVRIDDTVYVGPIDYHERLTSLYGDYMKPPEEKERQYQHLI